MLKVNIVEVVYNGGDECVKSFRGNQNSAVTGIDAHYYRCGQSSISFVITESSSAFSYNQVRLYYVA